MTETTGTIDFVVGSATYQTWYKALGDLHSGVRPVVLLHGGPGIPHHVLLNHDELYKRHCIPIVWYDQLGCGASTHLASKPVEFWTPELFLNELENVVEKLGIAADFDVLGHSWGGMLASLWAATRHPPGLKRIVITNSPASLPLWSEASARILSQMPQEIQDVVKRGHEERVYDDEAYEAALRQINLQCICRCEPWPEELMQAFIETGKDPTVLHAMYGADKFYVDGSLKSWDITGVLNQITQPTLVINGRYDKAQDFAVAPFVEGIPDVKWIKFEESSHLPCWEEPEKYYDAVGRFLTAA